MENVPQIIEREDERRTLAGKVADNLKSHFVDSTAIMTESTPLYAAFETFIAGMSPQISLNTRLISAASAYCGLGWVYAKGRDLSRRLFHIDETTKERTQLRHDTAYNAAFNFALSPIFYLAAGARDPKEIAIGTACGLAFGAVNGAPMGLAVDAFRDFTGVRPNDRIPNAMESLAETLENRSYFSRQLDYFGDGLRSVADSVRKLRPRTKKGIVTALVGGTIALTSTIYHYAPHKSETNLPLPTPQVVEYQEANQ